MQTQRKRAAVIAASVALVLVGTLLVSDRRVLLWEIRVNPGQSYIVGEWGDLGKASASSLVCRYFTGRSVQTIVYWHSPNNIMGRDQCPFLAGSD
jgi:hypothetical protein